MSQGVEEKNNPPHLDVAKVPFIEEGVDQEGYLKPEQMDVLWAKGWRHFGRRFFRYSYAMHDDEVQMVQPVRVVLEKCELSRSQERVLKRNEDLELRITEPRIDDARIRLFENHRRRFTPITQFSLRDVLGNVSDDAPCETVEVGAYRGCRLIAASYMDVGKAAVSSIYAMFDLAYSRRSLGIATMLWEIAFGREKGCRYYYPGYTYHPSTVMDYKKQFSGTETYDWRGKWRPLKK